MAKTKWNLDPTHSELGFKVKHMMITNVSGSFGSFNANVETEDDDFSTANIEFTIDVASINTGNEQRDGHLKSGDFFDVENHPQMKFVSNNVAKKGDNEYEITGDLSLHGVTKPVTFKAENGGSGKDPWGNHKTGFTIEGKIKRTDFGLNWNAALEAGGVLVSEDVKINGEIQLTR
jgi:polyisoprenoid-binding protein YceI